MSSLTAPKPQPKSATAKAPESLLSALDRCDRCGAQAFVKYENPSIKVEGSTVDPVDGETLAASGGVATVLFCAHHGREHGHALGDKGFVATIDETHRLDKANAAFKGED